jgi:RNA polymerase sigma-70 factor, ECF subfamily
MDLYVERQCVDNMKKGDTKQFLLLFEANFHDVFKYVARRVADRQEVEKIVRLTFLDALGQIQSTPADVGYVIWLYSLAKPRVWDHIAKSSFPGQQGLISLSAKRKEGDDDVVEKIDKMMKKLSLEEREILRLKFFEEVADGDLITILSLEEGKLGPRIYRVLKRAHFLLFGEDQEKKKVYFGKLSGLFEKVRKLEGIEVPEVFKLTLKADFTNRIERKNFAINGEVVKEKKTKEPFKPKQTEKPKGSNDPAKIFVEAVKEMREEEEEEREKQQHKLEQMEKTYDFIDKWKGILILIPLILFIWILILVVISIWGVIGGGGVERGYVNTCEIEVEYDGEMTDSVRRGIDLGITNRICDHFEVRWMSVVFSETGSVFVEVDVPDWFLEYRFARKNDEWKIKKYERTAHSYEKPWEIWRNFGSL